MRYRPIFFILIVLLSFIVPASAVIANAGSDQNILDDDETILSAEASSGTNLSYVWTVLSGPGYNPKHLLSNKKTFKEKFNHGISTIELNVQDEFGYSHSDKVTITVNSPPSSSFSISYENGTSFFDPSNSFDKYDSMEYEWIVNNRKVTNVDESGKFDEKLEIGTYQIKLTVTDELGATDEYVQTYVISSTVTSNTGSYKTVVYLFLLFALIVGIVFLFFKIKKQKKALQKQNSINAANNKKKYILKFLGSKDKDEPLNFCFNWNDDYALGNWICREMSWNHVEITRKDGRDDVIHFEDKRGHSGKIRFDAKDSIVHLTVNGTNDGIELIAIGDERELAVYSVNHKKLKNQIRNKVEELFGKVATPAAPTTATIHTPSKDDDKKLLILIDQLKNDLNIYGFDEDINKNIQRIHEKIRDVLHSMKKMQMLSKKIKITGKNTEDIDKIELYVSKCNSIIRSANEISFIIGKNNGNNDIDKCIENMQYLTDKLRSAKDDDSLNGKLAESFEDFIKYLDQDTTEALNPASIDEYNKFKTDFKMYSKNWNKVSYTQLYLKDIFLKIKTLIENKSMSEQYIEQWNPAIVEMDKIKTDDVIVQLEDIRHKVANVKQSDVKNDTICSVILDSLDKHLNEMKNRVHTADKLVLSNYIFYYSHILDMLNHLSIEIPVNDMPNKVKNQLDNTKNKLDKLSAIRDNPDFIEIHRAIPVHFIELSSKFYKWAQDLYERDEFGEALVMSDACNNTIDYTIALYTNNNFANLLRIITNYR